jgi:hypothetical protein
MSDGTEPAAVENAPLLIPEHLPRSLGEYELVYRSDEKTVWRRT